MSANKVPDNQIWYTTTDGNVIDVILKPSTGGVGLGNYGFGSQLISNTSGAKCIIKTLSDITQIGIICFLNSNLVSIQIPKYVDKIKSRAFEDCSYLTHIDMPKGITIIENGAFRDCASLQTIKLPEDLETIGGYCFEGCSSLEDITLNKNVKVLGAGVFHNCSSLKVLYSKAVVPPTIDELSNEIEKLLFYNTPINKIYVPFESVTAYTTALGWMGYSSKIEGYNFD